MLDLVNTLIQKYHKKGLLIDTNILLLYFVGLYDTNLILNFKRTRQFAIEDYGTLEKIINRFNKIVCTPNILTEINSFCNQFNGKIKQDFFEKFRLTLSLIDEKYIPSKEVAQEDIFNKFGLTDTGIMNIINNNYLLLTDDFRLSQYLTSIGTDVINFNHIRPLGWK